MPLVSMIALLLSIAVSLFPLTLQDRWAQADDAVLRLEPGMFPELPTNIASELRARGCTIPQAAETGSPSNVTTGDFLASGSNAWAVLCSVNRVSSILVFDDRGQLAAELSSFPDRDFLQGLGGGAIGFSRLLTTASPERILRYYEQAEWPPAERLEITHDGVDDGFMGKASSVLYFTRGQWIILPGAD